MVRYSSWPSAEPLLTIPFKRMMCAVCLRPQAACLCHWVTPLSPAVEVVILQHPLEVANAKGSARLLHLSLAASRMVSGEVFASDQLQMLLYGASGTAESLRRQPLLLYPETPEEKSLGLTATPLCDVGLLARPTALRLVVLDGTWRKSRKMLYLNPLLQALPRLSLCDPAPSRYRIRKSHQLHQLSTLEATCLALAQLDPAGIGYESLLAAFDGFVEHASRRMLGSGPHPA